MNSPIGQIQIGWLKTGSTGFNINPDQLKQVQVLTNKQEAITKNINTLLKNIMESETKLELLEIESNKKFQNLLIS